MKNSVSGKPGSYKVAKTGQSVRIVVGMARPMFNALEDVLKNSGLRYRDQGRNTIIGLAVLKLVESWGKAEPAPLEQVAPGAVLDLSPALSEPYTRQAERNARLAEQNAALVNDLLDQVNTIRALEAEIEDLKSDRAAPRRSIDYGRYPKPVLKIV
jgi:hypothetical protein